MSNGPDFNPDNALNPGGSYSAGSVTHGWGGFGSRTDPAGYFLGKFMHHGANVIPETPLQKAQADVAKSQWADYQKRWAPVITYFKNRTDSGAQAKKQLAMGEANTDIQGKFGIAEDQVGRALRGSGVESGSGRDISGTTKLADSKAAALGGSLSSALDASDAQYMNALSQIVGIGRGERVQADQSLNTLAGLSGEQATANAQAAAQEAAGTGEALGTGLGIAAGPLLRRGIMPDRTSRSSGPPTGLSQYNDPNNPPTADTQQLGGIY
jgi:hypothetical protein